jgi:hypothetical protein
MNVTAVQTSILDSNDIMVIENEVSNSNSVASERERSNAFVRSVLTSVTSGFHKWKSLVSLSSLISHLSRDATSGFHKWKSLVSLSSLISHLSRDATSGSTSGHKWKSLISHLSSLISREIPFRNRIGVIEK